MARLALAVIHLEAMLKIAELAGRAGKVGDARPAGVNGVGDDLIDGGCQSGAALPDNRSGQPPGADPGQEERLTDIDIAQAGNDFLIQKGRFDRRLAMLQTGIEGRYREVVRQGLGAELPEPGIGAKFGAWPEFHKPEPPGIIVGHHGAARQGKHDMIVSGVCPRVMMKLTKLRLGHGKTPGHPQMHDECLAGRELRGQEFRAPAEPNQLCAGQAGTEIWRHGEPQIRAMKGNGLQALSFHDRREASADGLDLWEFRHLAAPGQTVTTTFPIALRSISSWMASAPRSRG